MSSPRLLRRFTPVFSTDATTTTSAIIQYLPENIAREMLNQDLSIKIQCTQTGATIPCTVSMYWTTGASLPVIQASPSGASYSLVSSVSSTGVPTVGGGGNYGTWTQVLRNGLANPAPFTIGATNTGPDYSFSGFSAPQGPGSTTATYFAIVIGIGTMTYNLSSNQSVTINYASCVPGQIPTRPAAQTLDDVLRECRYYYETSYDVGTALATTTGSSPIINYCVPSVVSAGGSGTLTLAGYSAPFSLNFKEPKRAVPATGNITFYNYTAGTLGGARIAMFSNGANTASANVTFSDFWAFQYAGLNGATYFPNSATAMISSAQALPLLGVAVVSELNYVIDCRLGVL